MKRFFILISCILLIVSLSVSVFAAGLDWRDFVVSTVPGYEYDIKNVYIPADDVPIHWSNRYGTSADPLFSFTVPEPSLLTVNGYFFTVNDYLSVEGIDETGGIDIYFRMNNASLTYLSGVKYHWTDGSTVISTHTADSYTKDWDGIFTVDFSTKPENAVGLYFEMQIKGTSTLPAGNYSVELLGISFDLLVPPTLEFSPNLIHPQDYLVNESSNGDTSTLYVSVPASDLSVSWNTLRNDDYSIVQQSYGNPFVVRFDPQSYGYWIDLLVYDKLDITDIVDGSTMSVDYRVLFNEGVYLPMPSSVRYQVRYFDNAGNLLDNVNFFSVPDSDFYDDTKLDIVIDKPAGAVSMSFYLQFMDIAVVEPITFALELESINFVCDIPTMVRVQQETGRTNQLLNELINGDHGFDSSGSNFGSDADNLAGAGDQMDDAMGSGMDSLGAMTNSPMFTGTLATLAGAMDAIFVGHEITICGVTANPFTLAASILAIAILLPLALKFVFRKRGSG